MYGLEQWAKTGDTKMKTDEPFYNWFVLSTIIPNSKALKRLFNACGSSAEIISQNLSRTNLQKEYDDARDVEQICLDENITTITLEDPNYPWKLKQILDPPAIIYVRGKEPAQNEPMIAVVGSRKASEYMLSQAKGIAKIIAERGITVISGMARGSDMAAHKGALYAKKRTIAVLGESLTFKKKKEARTTIDEILENNGCIISEVQPWGNYGPGRHNVHLIQRNRITTALSDTVIITECDEKSGTMHAVKSATEQGKPIYAIPPVQNESNFYSHMIYLQQKGKLQFLEKGIREQIFLSVNRNCRA